MRHLTGVIQAMKTLSDGTVRISYDVPFEVVPSDVFDYIYRDAILSIQEGRKDAKEEKDGDAEDIGTKKRGKGRRGKGLA
jgi:hypothetical protein